MTVSVAFLGFLGLLFPEQALQVVGMQAGSSVSVFTAGLQGDIRST